MCRMVRTHLSLLCPLSVFSFFWYKNVPQNVAMTSHVCINMLFDQVGMKRTWCTFTWNSEDSNTSAAAAKSLQLCPTLCDPIDSSPPGSPVPGILQARTLEWVAISFSSAWTWKVKLKSFSRVQLLAAPWTAAHQAPPSLGFSRQEYWNGLPLPSPILLLGLVNFILWMMAKGATVEKRSVT